MTPNKKKEVIPVYYLYFQSILEKNIHPKREMPITEAAMLLYHWRIAKPLRYPILKEMENMKLIERVDSLNIRLINLDKNKILETPAKVCKILRMW